VWCQRSTIFDNVNGEGVGGEFGVVEVVLTPPLQTRHHEIMKRLPMGTPTSDSRRKRRGRRREAKKKGGIRERKKNHFLI